jgi:hypothetical protein
LAPYLLRFGLKRSQGDGVIANRGTIVFEVDIAGKKRWKYRRGDNLGEKDLTLGLFLYKNA